MGWRLILDVSLIIRIWGQYIKKISILWNLLGSTSVQVIFIMEILHWKSGWTLRCTTIRSSAPLIKSAFQSLVGVFDILVVVL